MKVFLIALLLQSMPLPPRVSMENPAAVSPIPPKLKKDYDKLWSQFVTAKDDTKFVKELDKFLKKQKNFDPALIIRAYLELHKGNESLAVQKFEEVLANNPDHRIAQYYLAELMFARGEYGRANSLYVRLLAADKTRVDLELKRQKALLMATENLLRSAARAEQESRLGEAEGFYREALRIVPNEPVLHERLADLLEKAKKTEEAAAERKIVDALTPRGALRTGGSDESKVRELEDLGRWGTGIESFREIGSAESITREQLALLIVRYFPQLTELRQNPPIISDISNSAAHSEIQIVASLGLIDPLPNHTFEPSAKITRGGFAFAMGRLIALLGLSATSAPPVSLPDLALTNARYREVQLALGYGLLNLEDSGSFNVSGDVTGKEAVVAAERLLRSFQQLQR